MGGQEHVGRLEIAVHDAARVQRRQGRQDAEPDRDGLGDRKTSAFQAVRQRLALEQLHRDEEPTLVVANLVDLAHVRVIDTRGGPGFAPESPAPRLFLSARGLRRDGKHARHRLQGNRPLEALVARLVHDAHPALAELAHHGVVRDARGKVRVRGRGWVRRQALPS